MVEGKDEGGRNEGEGNWERGGKEGRDKQAICT